MFSYCCTRSFSLLLCYLSLNCHSIEQSPQSIFAPYENVEIPKIESNSFEDFEINFLGNFSFDVYCFAPPSADDARLKRCRPSLTDDAVCLNICLFSNRQDVVLIADFIRNVQMYEQCFPVGLLEEKCLDATSFCACTDGLRDEIFNVCISYNKLK